MLCVVAEDDVSRAHDHLNIYGQFTLVTDFRALCFMSQETVKCDSSVNWKIAVVRQKF